MRRTLFSLVLLLALSNPALPQTPPVSVTGTWQVANVPYAPWTIELNQSGAVLTGIVKQNGAQAGPVNISEGAVSGTTVTFKAVSPDGARTITFTGTVKGDEIAFSRSVEVRNNNVGGTGVFGALAAPQFVARRGSASASAPVSDTSGRLHWVVTEGVAFAPWTLDLKTEGGKVTGVVGQSNADPPSGFMTSLVGPFDISDGKVEGNQISFKVTTPDGGRIVSFSGTTNDNQIAFTRSVQVVSGDPGRDGILGASGATKFTAKLDNSRPLSSTAATPAPAPDVAKGPEGRWQTTAVPNAPWTFEFKVAGTTLSGTVRQNGNNENPVNIAGGKVDGATISFKVLSPDAERTITFRGRVNGNEISFVRQIDALPGGSRGGNDLYGASSSLQFIARRAASSQ